MTYEHINVKRTHGAGGGLVWGINCSKKLPDKIVNELRNNELEEEIRQLLTPSGKEN